MMMLDCKYNQIKVFTDELEASVESHLMGICAEESRLKGGKLIYIHDTFTS